ncbi:hypothetical protein JCM21714_3912 [Gracilibacillus boraciitolerans JCM 21714]|uniref:Uncharacterized protein n=1 Tax=Gracilibacillus boraciitolerans JCM 21714 TaxID=1298598 RepID=W4VNE8_9BACI|nr:hypothetical protein [Gracilibacillus boraciitolerans]GAE94727.1 hypothetical protein JCM21714_3912 [Gracilibacillus boraciitolerans JCM 21714]
MESRSERTPKGSLEEFLEFQMKYKADTVKEAFPPTVDGNEKDALSDYYEWESLEEEIQDLKEKVYGD